MALPSLGPISFQQINIELKLPPTAEISLNDTAVRQLLGIPSGIISMQDAYGKSAEIRYTNTVSRTNANIYELMGSPTEPASYIFENNAEIVGNTATYALRTGIFPSGSTLTIINNNYIRGIGGTGSSAIATPGGAGGDVIYLDMSCQIDNTNGYIIAGGGGGGSAQRATSNSAYYIRAGGGGGAGSPAGAAGINTFTVATATFENIPPQLGTLISGGAGGTISAGSEGYYTDVAYGGAGGANGASGTVGSTITYGSSASYKNTPTIGVAGAAGRAIISNGKTLTQIAGFDSTRVKGAIV